MTQVAEQGSYKNDSFFYVTNNLGMYRVTINGRVLIKDEIQAGSDHISVYEDSREACRAFDNFIPAAKDDSDFIGSRFAPCSKRTTEQTT